MFDCLLGNKVGAIVYHVTPVLVVPLEVLGTGCWAGSDIAGSIACIWVVRWVRTYISFSIQTHPFELAGWLGSDPKPKGQDFCKKKGAVGDDSALFESRC